jgi:hypothetical protein
MVMERVNTIIKSSAAFPPPPQTITEPSSSSSSSSSSSLTPEQIEAEIAARVRQIVADKEIEIH